MSTIPERFLTFTYPAKQITVAEVYKGIPTIPEEFKVVDFRLLNFTDEVWFIPAAPDKDGIPQLSCGIVTSSPRLILEKREKVKREVLSFKDTGKTLRPKIGQYYRVLNGNSIHYADYNMEGFYRIYELTKSEVEEYVD